MPLNGSLQFVKHTVDILFTLGYTESPIPLRIPPLWVNGLLGREVDFLLVNGQPSEDWCSAIRLAFALLHEEHYIESCSHLDSY